MGIDSVGDGPVLVVDDVAEMCSLYASLLEEAGYRPLTAGSGEEAIAAAHAETPRLVVLDVVLPGISGYEVLRRLREEFGEGLPILLVSGVRTEAFDRAAGLELGGDDYLVKPFAPEEFVARVRTLVRRAAVPGQGIASHLTARELEVLRLLAQGHEQRQIADALVISPRTVGTHIEHILGKLEVRSRAQAVALAYQDELIGPSLLGSVPESRPARDGDSDRTALP
jgi:DNA-binding NarL/FixJ family response regulator